MKFYYTIATGKDNYTAGIKAPDDMCTILGKRGYIPVELYQPKIGENRFLMFIKRTANWRKISRTIEQNSVLVMQYPYGLSRVALNYIYKLQTQKGIKVMFVLHDINSARAYNRKYAEKIEGVLDRADYLICHNDAMKKYLTQKGISEEKLYSLIIFDYLHDYDIQELKNTRRKSESVIIAGNLSSEKSPYIKDLLELKRTYHLSLYGPNFDEEDSYSNYTYYGTFKPNELPRVLNGKYGLVWDGNSTETCSGAIGEYLRYINQHKASLYIASGIPAIVWSESGVADYIINNKLGYAIHSLEEVNTLFTIDECEYLEIQNNVFKEAEKLKTGYYLNNVLDTIESSLA